MGENTRRAKDPCMAGFGSMPGRGQAGNATSSAAALGKENQNPPSVSSGSPPGRWEWPAWCLNFKSPCIEVYVVDDDTGVGKWVEAEPQSRVVDKAGKDAYLCVEYEWDGEFYVQDFGPQHVRRRGQTITVLQ